MTIWETRRRHRNANPPPKAKIELWRGDHGVGKGVGAAPPKIGSMTSKMP